MRTPVAPTPADLVADEFLSYLQLRKGMTAPSYLQAPTAIPGGWETYTYRFQLLGRKGLPRELKGPLALRVYAGPEGLPRLRREWTFQTYLAQRQYPVARPVWIEEDSDFLGGPFMVMEWVEGEMMVNRLRRDHFALWWAPALIAHVHARLHKMPLRELAAPARPFLDRHLDEFQTVVDEYGLHGLAPGLAWLRAHRPAAEPPCMVHLDYHPRNILLRHGRCAAVLDWSEADIGDRHADVGLALLLIDVGPLEDSTLWDRLVLPVGRWITHYAYFNGYRRRMPLDRGRLRYYQAWAAMRRLTWYGLWLAAGPRAMGYKPGARSHVRPGHVAEIERYFEKHSGVKVRLLESAPRLASGVA